jgi:hypothetical protein
MPTNHIFCYNSPILFCNPKIQARKGLIIYNTTNGITTLKKTCECKSFYYCKNVWWRNKECIEKRSEETIYKKNQMDIYNEIINFFIAKEPF